MRGVRSRVYGVMGAAVLATAALLAGCRSPYAGWQGSAPAGVPRFARVSRGIYRGGQPSLEGFEELRRMGVRTVVSLRTFDPGIEEELEQLGLRQVYISFFAMDPQDDEVLEFLEVVTDPANQPVFIHCRLGSDRTGMMVAVYRIVVQDWPRQEAIREMEAYGHSWLLYQLREYVREADAEEIRSVLNQGGQGDAAAS